jgi:hypothetical protein
MRRFSEEFDTCLGGGKTLLKGRKIDCLIFADLYWDGSPRDLLVLAEKDPAFEIRGETRAVAFHRLGTEIRYWAGPRGDLLNSGPGDSRFELGVAHSVDDAVALATEYLGGRPLPDIKARRTPRPVEGL